MTASVLNGHDSVDPAFADLVEQLTARLQAGDRPDHAALLREHPEHADLLRSLLPALELLADLSKSGPRSLAGLLEAPNVTGTETGMLGDFRIIREVGRGGMGVVYEAEQISLQRRVALKVLPFAANMDPRHLQRFQNEARAAATLHHEHIVPVFAVGQERGVHYYAMQFIDGQTMAELIAVKDGARRAEQRKLPDSPVAPDSDATAAYKGGDNVLPSPPVGERGDEGPPHAVPAPSRARSESSSEVSGRGNRSPLGTFRDRLLRSKTRCVRGSDNQADTAPVAAALTQTAPRDRAFFRRAAEWSIQAAEALDHAHQLGIVHRDIKPGNLMIDHSGKLWVTDFGLARTGADAGLTMTGDVMGTLRYMSPEQALARHGLVDHRTDVYALGATLYELLTGRPAVEGQDRQEILKRMIDEEPRLPQSLEPAIPVDLGTILLKAMAKEPAERYATAKDLADDLRRFVEDRPIQAKPPTIFQRVRKLGQRHRQLVRASGLFLILLIAGLGVAVSLLWQEKEQTRKALAEAEDNYKRAETQRQRAESNFREAYSVVDAMLLVFNPYAPDINLAEVKKWQTQHALLFLAPFCEDPSDELEVRLQKGVAYVHTGRVYQILGERKKARQSFREAIVVFERIVQDYPDNADYPRQLGTALHILAEDLYLAGRIKEGNSIFLQAVNVWREGVRKHPTSSELPYDLAFNLCVWFDPELRNPREALTAAGTAIKLAPKQPAPWLAMGAANYRLEQWQAAAESLHVYFEMQEDLRKGGQSTAAALFLAMAQWRSGHQDEAMKTFHVAAQKMDSSFAIPANPHDRMLCSEAAALLGIKDFDGKKQPPAK